MQPLDDMELLREYASRHSEQAFATLVSRHIDLVYSAALRHIGNHHQAEEITQAVFVILARKAGSLGSRTVLAGWLFRTARLTAANYSRTERRRARREQEATMLSDPVDNSGDPWREIAPMLNDAIAGLRETERNAIVLRFLQGKGYKEVATALGSTEQAAQMRVSRALEKLRQLFAKRGVALSAVAIGSLIAANATQAAPTGLAISVSAAAVHGTAVATSTLALAKGTLEMMAWTKTKMAIGASVVVLLACQYQQNLAQAHQIAAAREELRLKSEAATLLDTRRSQLEEQNNNSVESRREMKEELSRLQAMRKSAGGSGASAVASAPGKTLLSAMLEDPAERETLRQQLAGSFKMRVAPLVKELSLDGPATEKLVQIGGDWAMKNMEAVAAFTEGRITATAAVRAGDESETNAMNQIRSLLGEPGLAKYEECDRLYPARSLVDQFDKQLGYLAIHELQRQRLSDLLAAQPADAASAIAGDFSVRDLVLENGLNRRFEQEQMANQRILESAATFLEPDQLRALGLMQANNLSTHKRDMLRLLKKL